MVWSNLLILAASATFLTATVVSAADLPEDSQGIIELSYFVTLIPTVFPTQFKCVNLIQVWENLIFKTFNFYKLNFSTFQ